MRGLKPHILGRVVGYTVPYRVDESQRRDENDDLWRRRTAWAEARHVGRRNFLGVDVHTGVLVGVPQFLIHTVMPETYNA